MISIHKINFRKIILKSFVMFIFFMMLMPNATLLFEKRNINIIKQENRKINPIPEFHPKSKNFYEELEKCYQDRLYYRSRLIKIWAKINYKAGVITKDHLFFGKNKWLFDKGAFITSFKDKDLKIKQLKIIQDFCSKKNVNFLLLIPPYKNSIYNDYIPKNISSKYPDYAIIENTLINECKLLGINYLSLYQPMIEARKNNNRPIYLSDDHHWSYEGAAVASDSVLNWIKCTNNQFVYRDLMLDGSYKQASKEHSQINALGAAINGVTNRTKAPWSTHYTEEIYGINHISNKEECKFTQDKDPVSNAYLWGKIVNGEGIIVNKNTNNKYTILFLNDSYGSYMTTYLSQFTHKIVHTHWRDKAGKKTETNLNDLISKYNPNLVILEMSSPSFYNSSGISIFNNIKM